MEPEQITTKAQKLIELAAAQGVALRFEEAVTVLVLNPGKQSRTLVKLAAEQYGKTADKEPEAREPEVKAPAAREAAVTEAVVQEADVKDPSVDKAAELTDAAMDAAGANLVVANAKSAQPTNANPTTAEPKTYSFDRKALKLLCETFFAGKDFYDDYEALRTKLVAKVQDGAIQRFHPDFYKVSEPANPLPFLSKIPEKVNAHLAKAASIKRQLTHRELLRTSEAQLIQTMDDFVVKLEAFAQQALTQKANTKQKTRVSKKGSSTASASLTEHNQVPSTPTLTYLDIVKLIEDFCSCLQVERPAFVFTDIVNQLLTNYPQPAHQLKQQYGKQGGWYYRVEEKYDQYYKRYLVDIASKTCPGAELLAYASMRLGVYLRVMQLADNNMLDFDPLSVEWNRPDPDGLLPVRWILIPYYFNDDLVERWLENQRERLENEQEQDISPKRRAQIKVVLRAGKLRREHLRDEGADLIAKIFRAKHRTIAFKKQTAERMLRAYTMSFDQFDSESDLTDLRSILTLKAASQWVELFNERLDYAQRNFPVEWRRKYNKFDFEKTTWPSIDGSRIEPKSWDQSLKEAMAQLGYSEKDVAF